MPGTLTGKSMSVWLLLYKHKEKASFGPDSGRYSLLGVPPFQRRVRDSKYQPSGLPAHDKNWLQPGRSVTRLG